MSDRYAGIAGLNIEVKADHIALDLSTPEQPEHTRLRMTSRIARDLAWELLDAADRLDDGA